MLQRGHTLHLMPEATEIGALQAVADLPAHAAWLGCEWELDAAQTAAILADLKPDWLITDHYALDARWEQRMQPYCRRRMVIDDLADRMHDCDLVLDQNLGRSPQHYQTLVPAKCEVLTGPRYALLRPEFAALRDYSLARRRVPQLRRLLVTMGGVDKDNVTDAILKALTKCSLPASCRITVVMGQHAPWLNKVREQTQLQPWATDVLVNVTDMARLMAESDLAIGAAGSTSWERCCLGLPTILVVLAANQEAIAGALEDVRAAKRIAVSHLGEDLGAIIAAMTAGSQALVETSAAAAHVTDGLGTAYVAETLFRLSSQ